MSSPRQGDRALDGCWDGLIVLCAANRYDGVKLADQHMAERIADTRPVLYVDPPMSMLSSVRNASVARALAEPRLRLLGPRLARFTPVVQPFPSRRLLAGFTTLLSRHLVRRAVSRLAGDVGAVVSAWPMHPILGQCGERVRVYWAQDDFVGGAALLNNNAVRLDAQERRTAHDSDLIVAANPTVAATWRERGYDPHLIPFGTDTRAYETVDAAAPAAEITLRPPIAGFVGYINSRIDYAILRTIADRGISLLLVGQREPSAEPGQWAELLSRPNVQWVGPKPFGALPSYLRSIDVGLVPYNDSPFNRGSFPLKTMEYLAAGRPVVSTDLPASRWLGTPLITIADGREAFTDAVERWARQPRLAADMAARRHFAKSHDWTIRAEAMLAAIDGTAPAMQTGVVARMADEKNSRNTNPSRRTE